MPLVPRTGSKKLLSKSIDTVVQDIYAYLEKVPEDLEFTIPVKVRAHHHPRGPSLRLSNIGRPDRQLWYEMNAAKNGIVPEQLRGSVSHKFLYGDVVEALFFELAIAAGHTVERRQETVTVDGVVGHIDGTIDGVLVDVKSCSSYSFNKFQTGALLANDPFGYIGQLSGYAKATGMEAGFFAVDKVSGEICLLKLSREEIERYDVNARIAHVRRVIASVTVPERCYEDTMPSKTDKSGNRVLSIGCSYCQWKYPCWSDSNDGRGLQLRLYSTGPKFFTKIVKEPRLKNDDFTSNFESKVNE